MTQRERQILQWIEQDPMISQEALAEKAGITRSSVAVHISNLMKKGYIAGKGYVLRSGTYAVVVGGVNIDIGGRSYGPLVARDSNPGRVQMSLGGVGRNIAHNMALLGLEVPCSRPLATTCTPRESPPPAESWASTSAGRCRFPAAPPPLIYI